MKRQITNAIKEKRLIHLLYEGRSRKVEAYAWGRNCLAEEVLVCRQVFPWVPREKSWQVLNLSRVYGLLVLERPFENPDQEVEIPGELLAGLSLSLKGFTRAAA